jgi:hypothetical protein
MRISNRYFCIVLFAFIVTAPAIAANHYVRIGASGNGSDWNNACPGFTGACAPSSLVRGDAYYVASGNYPSVSFNTPTSGALVITIKKATVADHGTSVGWNDSYGTGAAKFARNIDFNSNYWTFDGATGGGPDSWKTGFGFVIDTRGSHSTCVSEGGGSNGYHDLIFRHFECIGDAGGAAIANNYCTFFGPGSGPITLEYTYCHDIGGVMVYTRTHNLTIQYSWFENIKPDPGAHTEGIYGAANENTPTSAQIVKNYVVRYTVWKDIGPPSGPSGVTGVLVCQCDGWDVYGNVIINSGGGQGGVTTWNEIHNARIYNNTFIGVNKGINFTIGQVNGDNIVAHNNLFYNTAANFGNPNYGGTVTHDYSWCGPNAGSACTSEANDQNAGTTDPFVNLSANDFHLKSNTNPGRSLGSPYDVDPDGIVRSTSAWDRGAFQSNGAVSSRPNPPTGLTASVL